MSDSMDQGGTHPSSPARSGGTDRTGSVPADDAAVRAALEEYSKEFLLLLSARGELVAASTDEALGYRGDERAGHHIAEHLHPDDLPRVFDLIERARSTTGFEETVTMRARRADGSWGTFEATVIDAMGNPALRGAVVRVREVDPRVQDDLPAQAEVVESTGVPPDRFFSLAESLPLGILSADARGYVVFCNEAAQQILNLPVEQLLGYGWEKAIHGEDLPDVVTAAGGVLVSGHQHQITFRVQTGLFPRWAHAKFVPLGTATRRSGWIATVDDVTDRRRAESRLAHAATHDPLTGLPNRNLLDDRLHQACGRLRRGSESVTVLFVDLDNFKGVNDNYGHAAGDRVLIEVANRLLKVVREVDTVARLGGDEFVIVCENLTDEEEERLIDRIDSALGVPLIVDRDRLKMVASIGSAVTHEPLADSNDLLAQADQSMYRVKQLRRTS
jgi:diguanylate cyclase (GGDEF)-like protein/PAS domain S-box-containing protein